MCLAIPALVVRELEAEEAIIDAGGVEKRVSLALVPEAAVGDYVIVHAGYAISRLDPEEALRTLALFAEMQGDGQAAAA
ncbi:MAG: HypC/HybG/HupF family hydrogenase formation chaperone [Burkholderiales bacterium]|nr:HypC/HybG/HupF family hydrogenase formation chaperone [Burkholderiales bacterium]